MSGAEKNTGRCLIRQINKIANKITAEYHTPAAQDKISLTAGNCISNISTAPTVRTENNNIAINWILLILSEVLLLINKDISPLIRHIAVKRMVINAFAN